MAKSGQPWATMQARRGAVLQQAMPRVCRALERLQACTLGGGERGAAAGAAVGAAGGGGAVGGDGEDDEGAVTAALHAQSCTALFLMLAGLAAHPMARHAWFVPEAAPASMGGTAPSGDGGSAPGAAVGGGAERRAEGGGALDVGALPPLRVSMLAEPTPEPAPPSDGDCEDDVTAAASAAAALPYLSLYKQKLGLWSCYLLSQWGVARALSIPESSTMQREAEDLRSRWSWCARQSPRARRKPEPHPWRACARLPARRWARCATHAAAPCVRCHVLVHIHGHVQVGAHP